MGVAGVGGGGRGVAGAGGDGQLRHDPLHQALLELVLLQHGALLVCAGAGVSVGGRDGKSGLQLSRGK